MVVGSDIDGRQMRGKGEPRLTETNIDSVHVGKLTLFASFYLADASGPGVFRAATKYGLRNRILDCLTFDVTRNGWRRGGLFDAIITDPPCKHKSFFFLLSQADCSSLELILGNAACIRVDGVRAGAKRLGRNEKNGRMQKDEPVLMPDGTYSHL